MDIDKIVMMLAMGCLVAPALVSASNLTMECPSFAYIGLEFEVRANYSDNGLPITGANVTVAGLPLSYDNDTGWYSSSFYNDLPEVWVYNITADKIGYEPKMANCTTVVYDLMNLTIYLWQQREGEVFASGAGWVVTQKNYDKQLDMPYINDFAYLIAVNRDQNCTYYYDYCSLAMGSAQKLVDTLNYGNWMGDQLTATIVDLIGKDKVDCDKCWLKAEYESGVGILELPYPGNYSLYVIDGNLVWENEVSPPVIKRSDLFLPLGEIELQNSTDYTTNFWLSHADLDWWGSFTSTYYVVFALIIPFLITVLLIYIGVSFRLSIAIALGWSIIWTIIRML
jgi:hypothetical protein